MCRWVAYMGKKIFMDRIITRPEHSLLAQSLNAKMSVHSDGSIWATNGDGFGVGWYDQLPEPGLFRDKMPAWNDENLHELTAQTSAHLFLAHIRATTTGAVQRTNSHPFKYKNWLFQHNGYVDNFPAVRRDLQMDVAPDLFRHIKGTTDSETFFYLALTYGLQDNPKQALEKMAARIERACADNNIPCILNLSVAVTDGKTIWTVRYATEEKQKTQFYSTDAQCLKDTTIGSSEDLPSGSVLIVSEPLDSLNDKWTKVPENSFCTFTPGHVEIVDFIPK